MTSVRLNLLLSKFAELDAIRTVDLLGDDLNLLFDGQVQVVQELEVRWALADGDYGFGKSTGTCTTLGPVVADDGCICAASKRLLSDEL